MVMAWGLGLEHKKLLQLVRDMAWLWQFMAWWLEGRSLNINRLPGGLRQVASMMSCTVVGLLALLCRSNIQCLRDLGCASKLRFYGHPSPFRGCWWWALQCGFSRQIYRAKMAKLLSKAAKPGSAGRDCLKSDVYSAAFGSVLVLQLVFANLIAPKLGWSHELTAASHRSCYRMATLQGSWKYCGAVETLYRFMWVAWLESERRKGHAKLVGWEFSVFFSKISYPPWSPSCFDFMEPENTPLEKENHLPNHDFQVLS